MPATQSSAAGGGNASTAQTKSGKPPLHEYPAASLCSTSLSHFGIDSTRHNALAWIDKDIVVMAAGRFVLFLHLSTGHMDSQELPCEGGVGTVAVHPSRQCYVVGRRAVQNPSLVVCEWPSRKQTHTLEGGAVVGFSAIAFDLHGTRMATVADSPDFTLSVWDWQAQTLILRNKCFGTDVYSVAFSRFDNSLLTTGGVGHIKFWVMASTFTGKKLKGTLGKFGRLEISDISGFAVLPDGKVISGAENGCLLLWEGDLVKCSFVQSIDKSGTPIDEAAAAMGPTEHAFVPVHAGNINCVQLIHDGQVVVSCGEDGYIRYWDSDELEQAEGEGTPALYAPKCLLETCVGEDCAIRSVTYCESSQQWVVLDRAGTCVTAPFPSLDEIRSGVIGARSTADIALRFNGGAVLCGVPSPTEHVLFTGGEDGFVRAVNYIDGVEDAAARLFTADQDTGVNGSSRAAVTAMVSLSPSSPDGQSTRLSHEVLIAAGGADGRVCVVEASRTGFAARSEWRPHTDPVLSLCIDPQRQRLCSVSVKGSVFFFAVSGTTGALTPIGFCESPLDTPLCAAWDANAGGEGGVLIGFKSGQVLSFQCPAPDEVDTSTSYEFAPRYALIGIRQRKLPPPVPEDEKLNAANLMDDDMLQEPDDGPWPVVLIEPLPSGEFAIGMDKEELVYAYGCTVRYAGRTTLPPLPPTGVEPEGYVEEPGRNLCYRDEVPCRAFVSSPQTELLVVCAKAQVVVHSLEGVSPSAKVQLVAASHDCTAGQVTSAHTSFDGTVFVTTGSDGLVVSSLRVGCTTPAAQSRPAAKAVMVAANIAGPETALVASTATALSIQQQKEAHDEAAREAARQSRLNNFLARLRDVQNDYEDVLQRNAQLPLDARLTPDELELDATMTRALQEEQARRVHEARKEFALEAARENRRTEKLRRRFVDNLLYDRVVLHAFNRQFDVASFRTVDPSDAIARLEKDMAALQVSDADEETEEDGQPPQPADLGVAAPSTQKDPRADGTHNAHGAVSGATPADGATGASGSAPAHTASAGKTLKSGMSASVKQQLDKQEERQRERDERRRGFQELLTRKPDPSEDTRRLEAQRARDLAARGECVFRTDPQYRSEPAFRPNAIAKLQRMIDLQRLIVHHKSAFNETLLAQRKEKSRIIDQVNVFHARIEQINTQLKDHRCDASKLTLLPDECPEKLFEMSRADLDTYAVQVAEEKARQEQAKQAQRGFGADLAGATRKESGSTASDHKTSVSSPRASTLNAENRSGSTVHHAQRNSSRNKSAARSGGERGSRSSTIFTGANRDRMDAELRAKLDNIRPSELEEEEAAMMRLSLLAERERLSNQAQQLMKAYDTNLQRLLDTRMELDGDVCFAEGQLLLLFREYQMLLLYRQRDKELRQQLVQVRRSRDAARREIDDFKKQGVDHETTLAHKQDAQKELKREAEAYIHANSPADKAPYLLKVFQRHIKRRKHGAEDDDNDDITSDEDEEDDAADDVGEEVCPSTCDAEVWATVLQLRERRLDLVDAIADGKASCELLKRKAETVHAKVAALSKQIDECLQQIEQLDAEKRNELNRLDMVVPLRCDQVTCLTDDACPFDLRSEKVMVIADDEMRRLRQRVYELADLKCARRDECESMLAAQQAVRAEKAEARSAHSEWETKVYEVMRLKFGQQVDLEMLESCGSSRRIEAKKEALRQLELSWERTLRQYERKIENLRDKLQGKIVENTHLLQDYGDYESERQEIERALTQSTAKTVQRYRGARVATKEDRANLRELIAAQQEEIDALTTEIMMLSRKGGHAYSPQMA